MNKILLIIHREFLSRVKKKSFLIATLIVPILFPAIFGGLGYLAVREKQNIGVRQIMLLNLSDSLKLENTKNYEFVETSGSLEQAITAFKESKKFAFLYIPSFTLEKPEGMTLYAKTTMGPTVVESIEGIVERKVKDLKLAKYNIESELLDKLKTIISLDTKVTSEESNEETDSNSMLTSGIGYFTGFLIYLFLFVYGGQVMQGVIEEKNSKIVEIIVSTVKPFDFMLGKVIGVAAVALTQILIWVALTGTIYTVAAGILGSDTRPQQITEMVQENAGIDSEMTAGQNDKAQKAFQKIEKQLDNLPIVRIVTSFIFFFIGGYLLYAALFAAVGSAVDTPADAQQFMMPIMLPIIIGFAGLAMFVFDDPNGSISFWLSVIPFTSPIVMMGRIGFGVPLWELILSMVLLVGGFIFTIWLAGRIYRVGILMHGTKVNYRVLVKWFMMKN